MVIKLYLEKAYDVMEWKVIEETPWDALLPTKMIAVIMNLVPSSSCRLGGMGKSHMLLNRPEAFVKEIHSHPIFLCFVWRDWDIGFKVRWRRESLEAEKPI